MAAPGRILTRAYQGDHTRLAAPLTYEVSTPHPEEALVEVNEAVSAD